MHATPSPHNPLCHAALDANNRRMGRDSVFYAASGIKRDWAMAAAMRTPHFTTDWRQLPTVRT
jgi:DNA polymerase V